MLELLRSRGLVLAPSDHRVLSYLEFRRHARALPLYSTRGNALPVSRAWQITDAGVAAALRLAVGAKRKGFKHRVVEQIDLEEHLAATAEPEPGRRPEAATRPVPDAPAVTAADVSAPEGRPSRRAADRPHGARGQKPETACA
jgi:hypothetical protein